MSPRNSPDRDRRAPKIDLKQAPVAAATGSEIQRLCLIGVKVDSALKREIESWNALSSVPAVRNGRVFAVDANSYFARPGPRVVDGTELLAHLFHPDLFKWKGPPSAFRRIDLPGANLRELPAASAS